MTTATLERRITALERTYGAADAGCPVCGHRCSDPVRYELGACAGPEFCDGCGCRRWLKLRWPEELPS